MKISIVIPAYNAEKFLAPTLDSVLAQTFTDWELILVNDGSSDDTSTVACGYAARDARIRVIDKKNGGVAAARNTGLEHLDSTSEFVIFLDHDDLWCAEALETLSSSLNDKPEAVGAHGLALLVKADGLPFVFNDGGGSTVDWCRRKMVRRFGITLTETCTRSEPTTFNVQVYDGCICTPGLLLARRSAIESVGGFDTTMTPCDDWDMWVRLSLIGPVAFVDKIILNWRIHGGNASLDKRFMGQGVSQVRRKMFHLPGISLEQSRLAHTRYRRMYASIERHNSKDSLRWAKEHLDRREWTSAGSLFAQSLRYYARYLSLVMFWGRARDRGPIPERLTASRSLEIASVRVLHLPPTN